MWDAASRSSRTPLVVAVGPVHISTLLGRAWWDRKEGLPGSVKEETTGLGGDDGAAGRGSNVGTASRACAGPAWRVLGGRARKDGRWGRLWTGALGAREVGGF